MPIHSISRFLNTLNTYDMDVGCSLRGFGRPSSRQSNKYTHQKPILASKKSSS